MSTTVRINFAAMDSKTQEVLRNVYMARMDSAQENIAHNAVIKPLRKTRKVLLDKQDAGLKDGRTYIDVMTEYSTDDVDARIARENERHNKAVRAYNDVIATGTALVPAGAYDAYKLKISGKRGQFLQVCKDFLGTMGRNNCSNSEVSKFAEHISDLLGGQLNTSAGTLKTGMLFKASPEKRFNALFIYAFLDAYCVNTGLSIDGRKYDATTGAVVSQDTQEK